MTWRSFPATSVCVAIAIAVLLCGGNAGAQYQYRFIFRGMAYQTNASGNVIQTPITDQTLLQDRAQAGGITDLSTVAIVYHIGGDPKGDTVEIAATNGVKLALEFGLWFGSDPALQRSAVVSATGLEEHRVDYVYTLDRSQYTSPNSHSSGAAFVTKRFITDSNGNLHATIEGPISWIVNPQGTNGTIVCRGHFTLGELLF